MYFYLKRCCFSGQNVCFMLINIKKGRGRSIAAWAFFAQLPQGLVAQSPLGLSLCSRSSREGFSFLLPEQKKRNKENSPSALFCLLRYFSPLNKKNSLRSNSFLFFTLRKAPSLHAQKVRPDLCAFFMQHRFARWGVMFSFFRFARFFCHPERSEAMCPPEEGFSGLSGGA